MNLWNQTERFIHLAASVSQWLECVLLKYSRSTNPLVLGTAIGISCWASLSLGQDISWDVLNYHFYAGYALLHKPFHYDFAPAQVQSFFNPLQHVLTYLLLEYLPAKIAAGFLGAIQGLNFYLLFRISETLFASLRSLHRMLLSVATAATGFYGIINICELGTTFGDNLASILVLTAILLVIRHLLSEEKGNLASVAPLCAAGMMTGLAFGIKLTFITYAVALSLALSVTSLTLRRRFWIVAAFLLCVAAGFLAAYGFWGTNLFLGYANPVFPHFNVIFRSPYFDLNTMVDARFMPRNWQQVLFYPFFFARTNSLVIELEFRDIRLALCYLLIFLLAANWIIGRIRRRHMSFSTRAGSKQHTPLLLLFLFFLIAYVFWQYLFCIYRYLIVLELLAPAFIAIAVYRLVCRRMLALFLVLILDLAICLSAIHVNFGRQQFDDYFLSVLVPPVPELDRCVILMGGEEGTSYMVPSFPAETRFIRIKSNFLHPGQNRLLDERIHDILGNYDTSHTLIYTANDDELEQMERDAEFYGIRIDRNSRLEITSIEGPKGYLYSSLQNSGAEKQRSIGTTGDPPVAPHIAAPIGPPRFVKSPDVKLSVSSHDVVAGIDTLQFKIYGLRSRTIDILFTIDGEQMPPLLNWSFDANLESRIPISQESQKGLYHIIGIRESGAPDPNLWIEVDVPVRIR